MGKQKGEDGNANVYFFSPPQLCGEKGIITQLESRSLALKWSEMEKGQKERRSQDRTFQGLRGRGVRNLDHLVPVGAHCPLPRPLSPPLALEVEGEPSPEKLAH